MQTSTSASISAGVGSANQVEGSLVLERKTSPEITELLPELEMADMVRTLPVLVLPNI